MLSHKGMVAGGTGELKDREAFGKNNFSLEPDDPGQLPGALRTPGATALPAARPGLVGHSRGGA